MLRIHVTTDDLVRIRVSAGPSARWETILSLAHTSDDDLAHWCQRAVKSDADLDHALMTHYDTAVAPDWPKTRSRVESDRQMRIRTFLDGGVDGLLRSLRSVIQWRFPLLEVASVDGPDLHLDGRGLVLQPAYFCQGDAVGLIDRDQQPLLIYPIEPAVVGHGSTQSFRPAAHLGRGRRAGSDRLAALLGATRAAILGAVGVGGTTTDLGRRVGIAKASASHHVSALRAAGLVVSRRHGGAVLHTLTPLGDALLGGSLDDGPTDGR